METENKKKINGFTDLVVWQASHSLTLEIYKITKNFPKEEMYSLVDQTRRASSSISANIAEGFGRQTMKDKMHFYYIARGSLTEVHNHILLARDIGYLDIAQCNNLLEKISLVQRLLQGLINKSRSLLHD